jgi:hypothetical protein
MRKIVLMSRRLFDKNCSNAVGLIAKGLEAGVSIQKMATKTFIATYIETPLFWIILSLK